jgi:hypothetical protein
MHVSPAPSQGAIMRPGDYYRLPWTLTDNVLSWLEPTKKCNLYCEGCYSTNEPHSHKSLATIRQDLDVFVAHRKMDSVSIAGGDPLTHPDIVEIVRIVRAEYGLKPVVNTNGLAMTPALLRQLKAAGLHGVTFHVDSSQARPGWKGKDELELCALRDEFAAMVAGVGGLSCAFNATVFRDSLHQVPALVRWAQRNIDRVQVMVFILFRTARSAEFAYLVDGRPVGLDQVTYRDQDRNPTPLTTQEVVGVIRRAEPGFDASAYLGGTRDPDSFKWTLFGRVGTPARIYGYVGPKFMETVQTAHHAVAGRYLAYADVRTNHMGRSLLAGFAPIDAGVRRAAGAWLGDVSRAPKTALRPLHFQSLAIIQPIDMTAAGEANMCDGCPDMTVHDGKLVWSCRLDELRQHGAFFHCVPIPRSG